MIKCINLFKCVKKQAILSGKGRYRLLCNQRIRVKMKEKGQKHKAIFIKKSRKER